MTTDSHERLVIPGPVEVRPEVLAAQTAWMIGHRSKAFAELFEQLQNKLRQVFYTESRVLVSGASGTGLWEGASRNTIRDGRKALHLTAGAFSERWAQVSELNGKQVDRIQLEWGEAHTAEMVAEALSKESYDAVFVVHNETSTGVVNPIKEIGEVVRQYPDTLLLVDTVSGFLGSELRVDEWGIDVALTSSQKAFALPPGLAFAAVSDRTLERAAQVPNRGYYFDFIDMDKSLQKNNTSSTPPVSLMYAADYQLDSILAEGLENRWARHTAMRDTTQAWALDRGFGLFAPEGYRSHTVTTVDNRERGIDVDALAAFMKTKGFAIDKGYGKIKGPTFRVAHMGDMQAETLQEVLDGFDAFLNQ
jgi:predicted phosphoserine aminotransferase